MNQQGITHPHVASQVAKAHSQLREMTSNPSPPLSVAAAHITAVAQTTTPLTQPPIQRPRSRSSVSEASKEQLSDSNSPEMYKRASGGGIVTQQQQQHHSPSLHPHAHPHSSSTPHPAVTQDAHKRNSRSLTSGGSSLFPSASYSALSTLPEQTTTNSNTSTTTTSTGHNEITFNSQRPPLTVNAGHPSVSSASLPASPSFSSNSNYSSPIRSASYRSLHHRSNTQHQLYGYPPQQHSLRPSSPSQPNSPFASPSKQTAAAASSGSSSSSSPSSYITAADEYLRLVDTSIKSLRSLFHNRHQLLQQEQSQQQSQRRLRKDMDGVLGGGSSSSVVSPANSTSPSGAASSTPNNGNVGELNEMINYLVWFSSTALSKLLIKPEPWHFSSTCAHPHIATYAPFCPHIGNSDSSNSNNNNSPNSNHGDNISPASTSTLPELSADMKNQQYQEEQQMLNQELNHRMNNPAPLQGILTDQQIPQTSARLSTRSTSFTSLTSTVLTPSPSHSPASNCSPILLPQDNHEALNALPAMSAPVALPSMPSMPLFAPPRLLPITVSAASLFSTSSSTTGQTPTRPTLTLAYLSDIVEQDALIKEEREEEDRAEAEDAYHNHHSNHPAASNHSGGGFPGLKHSKVVRGLFSNGPPSPVISPYRSKDHLTANGTTSVPSTVPPPPPPPLHHPVHVSALELMKAHFRALFLSPSHPYGYALQTFIQHMQDETGDRMNRWLKDYQQRKHKEKQDKLPSNNSTPSSNTPPPTLSTTITTVTSDPEADESSALLCQSYLHHQITLLRSFIYYHYRLVLASYPQLPATHMCRKIAYYILQSIVYDALSKTLLTLYQQVYKTEDTWLMDTLKAARTVGRTSDTTDAGVTSDTVYIQYADTIEKLKEMFTTSLIRDKLSLIVNICKSISQHPVSKDGGDQHSGSTTSTGLLSSDDLVSVLSACLQHLTEQPDAESPSSTASRTSSASTSVSSVSSSSPSSSSPCVHVYSQLRLLNECMDESMIMGEKGFCMTTLTVALQSLCVDTQQRLDAQRKKEEQQQQHQDAVEGSSAVE